MKALAATVLFGTFAAFLTPAHGLAPKLVWVDCAASSGGNGRLFTPYSRIGAAVSAERPAVGTTPTRRVLIVVLPGVCANETFPIRLDYPLTLLGSRIGIFDGMGLPVDGQIIDTLVLGTAAQAMFPITANDVHVAGLSLDGQQPSPAPIGPLIGAFEVTGVSGYALFNMRVLRATTGVVSRASSGLIHGSFFGTVREAMTAFGGTAATPADVWFVRNRVKEHVTGGIAVVPANPAGDDLSVVIKDNEFSTSYLNTGPSNPFGVRLNTVFGGPPNIHGKFSGLIADNRFLGSHRYPLIVSGGGVLRAAGGVADANPYTGTATVIFHDNFIDRANVTANAAIITFTNSRATELPCELNPANVGAACPTVQGGRYWKDLQAAAFDLSHNGELDDVWIDHPATDPVSGTTLGNVLTIDGEEVPNQTFVVVP